MTPVLLPRSSDQRNQLAILLDILPTSARFRGSQGQSFALQFPVCLAVLTLILGSLGCSRTEIVELRLSDVASIEYSQDGEPESMRAKFVELDREMITQLKAMTSLRDIEINESKRHGFPLLEHLSSLENLQSLVLNHVEIRDEELAELRGAKNLERLELSQTGLTGMGLRHLSELPLKRLLICDNTLTAEGLEGLAALKQLEELELCLPLTRVSAIPSLAGLKNLKRLYISQVNFDYRVNGGLNCVEGADSVEHLVLSGRKLTARVLSAVGRMQGLKNLVLERGIIEDDGIERLSGMQQLQRIEIHEASGLTDRSLSMLASMRALKELRLSDTRMAALTLPQLAAVRTLTKVEIFGQPLDPQLIDDFFAVNAKCQLSTSVESLLDSGRQSRSFVSHQPRY